MGFTNCIKKGKQQKRNVDINNDDDKIMSSFSIFHLFNVSDIFLSPLAFF